MVQNMSCSRSGLLDPVFWKGVEPLVQRGSRSAHFGAKVAPSLRGRIRVLWTELLDLFVEQSAQLTLQRADLSFMNSVTGSICRAKCSNILHDNDLNNSFIWLKVGKNTFNKNIKFMLNIRGLAIWLEELQFELYTL
jgi:hypothetical protein